jgi:hypothetical protein
MFALHTAPWPNREEARALAGLTVLGRAVPAGRPAGARVTAPRSTRPLENDKQ